MCTTLEAVPASGVAPNTQQTAAARPLVAARPVSAQQLEQQPSEVRVVPVHHRARAATRGEAHPVHE